MINFKYDIVFGLLGWEMKEPKRGKDYHTSIDKPDITKGAKVKKSTVLNRIFKTQHKL